MAKKRKVVKKAVKKWSHKSSLKPFPAKIYLYRAKYGHGSFYLTEKPESCVDGTKLGCYKFEGVKKLKITSEMV